MFLFFWKKKKQFNKIELERFILHKTESLYYRSNYYYPEPRNSKFGIHTVIKNVPISIEGGTITAKVRYIGIPDVIVYFMLRLSNVQEEFVSSSNTIDVIVNATIKGEECNDFNFKLSPIYERRVLICGEY